MALDSKLLELLVCPVSKASLTYKKEADELWCRASGLAYPIRDGIPGDARRGSAGAHSERAGLPERLITRGFPGSIPASGTGAGTIRYNAGPNGNQAPQWQVTNE